MSGSDLLSVLFGLILGVLMLIWTVRLFWIVTAPLWRREEHAKPEAQLSVSDARFLRSLHIKP